MDFKEEIVKLLKPVIEIDTGLIEEPPDPNLGDFAIPCFKFSKELKKSPVKIAEEFAVKIKPNEIFAEIKNTGPYLNFFVNRSILTEEILSKIFTEKEKYGEFDIGKGRHVVVDYSSPNIAKPFGIAHIRSTVIGSSICKIYDALGYKSVGINHLGDWGTQFGKLMVAYNKWGNPELLKKDGINYLVKIYVEFGQKAKEDPQLDVEARKWFKMLEDGKPKAVSLWKKFREMSMNEFNKYYDLLGIKFDYVQGEAFYNNQLEKTVEYIKKKVPTEISDGALIVDLKSKGIKTPLLLRKSDGATTYHTRDLAAALYRLRTFDPAKILYVVGTPQKLHFKQLYAVLSLIGEDATRFTHVNFGNMTYEGQMMSTRAGNFVELKEVLDRAVELAKETIEQKNANLKNKEEVARQVGVGAIIFGDLSNDRTRDVEFNWKKALSFEGETAPYLQYTHARICSIERKASVNIKGKINVELLAEPFEFDLVKLLEKFPGVVLESAKTYKPNLIANYLISVAQTFNKFYNKCPIIKEKAELKNARLLLADCTRFVIEKGLALLGIEAPSEM